MSIAERRAAPPPLTGRVSCLLVVLLLLVGAVLAALYYLSGPRFRFTNRLAAPVSLVIGGGEPRRVGPGETTSLRLARGQTLVAEWSLVRPLSADGTLMGEEIRGSAVLRGPTGLLADSADTIEGEADYFAPLITNATGGPVRLMVNAGLPGALDCGCAVRPGGRRVFIGYYRLYQNSTVQARGSRGEATFRELGPQVTTRDGTVGLRFEDRDFWRPR